MIPFRKYHGLGNDYLVLDPRDAPQAPAPELVRRVCHRNFGLGSDGILYGPLPAAEAEFGVRIFNPDGSEAEKSGNGLRIFARYLFDTGRADTTPFRIHTAGGVVQCRIHAGGDPITIEMGQVSFDSAVIPVRGPRREVLDEPITVDGLALRYSAATIGNPHCVVPLAEVNQALACRLGPLLENDPRFPNRSNVQLLKVLDRANIRIEIWERGAGYTLASGSSSSAAGAVARRLGLVDAEVAVHMPGGIIQLHIDATYAVTMTGPTVFIGEMRFAGG